MPADPVDRRLRRLLVGPASRRRQADSCLHFHRGGTCQFGSSRPHGAPAAALGRRRSQPVQRLRESPQPDQIELASGTSAHATTSDWCSSATGVVDVDREHLDRRTVRGGQFQHSRGPAAGDPRRGRRMCALEAVQRSAGDRWGRVAVALLVSAALAVPMARAGPPAAVQLRICRPDRGHRRDQWSLGDRFWEASRREALSLLPPDAQPYCGSLSRSANGDQPAISSCILSPVMAPYLWGTARRADRVAGVGGAIGLSDFERPACGRGSGFSAGWRTM